MADTIMCFLSLLLSCCSLLCLEDEVALRVCISFDSRDSHVMQLVLIQSRLVREMLMMLSTWKGGSFI